MIKKTKLKSELKKMNWDEMYREFANYKVLRMVLILFDDKSKNAFQVSLKFPENIKNKTLVLPHSQKDREIH